MAKFTVEGIDLLIQKMERANIFDENIQKEMLFEGAKIIKENIQSEMNKSKFDIRKLSKNIVYSKKIKRSKKDDSVSSTLSISGKNKKRKRNGEILFVLNYGRKKSETKPYGAIKGEYFWSKGKTKSEKILKQKMEEIVINELKKRGLE